MSKCPPSLIGSFHDSDRLSDKINALEWIEKYYASYLQSRMKVVDIGCGPALLTEEIARRYSKSNVVGLDLSLGRTDRAKRSDPELPNLSFVSGEATSMPFPDDTFDLAICRLVLESLPDPLKVVPELVRIVRSGGTVILQDVDGHFLWHYPLDSELEVRLSEILGQLGKIDFDPFIGRKLYTYALQSGLEQLTVRIDPYDLYAGRISERDERFWQMKLRHALSVASESLGGQKQNTSIAAAFMDHLRSEEGLTYSVLFTVVGRVK